MRLAIELYATDETAVTAANVVAAIATVDYAKSLKVSRTIGPANYYDIQKRFDAGENVAFPSRDIDDAEVGSAEQIATLVRRGSVLSVSYAYAESQRIGALTQALHAEVPTAAKGFFESDAGFHFGPSDIIKLTEDADGEDDVELVAVAQFTFSIACDDYRGNLAVFRETVPFVQEFRTLRAELERIVGPLKLHIDD